MKEVSVPEVDDVAIGGVKLYINANMLDIM
jgi:hypothetical protein